ncbi:MAG: zinc finger Ran-binding domain-containing protein [Thermoplasmata archaeon]
MPLKFDLLNETFECPVCGYMNHISAKLCEKCKTIFPDKKPLGGNMELNVEIKETKGKNVRRLIRSLPEKYKKELKPKTRDEVIRDFQMVPGITKEIAEKLYDVSGIHSLSELIYSMLSNQQIKGAERTAVVFEEYILVKKAGGKAITCPFCKTKIDVTLERCPVCDASVEDEIIRLEYEKVSNGLSKFVNELMEELQVEEKEEALEKAAEKPPGKVEEKPSEAEQKLEEKKIKLSLDELEEVSPPVEKKKLEIPEVVVEKKEEEKISLDIDDIEKVEKEVEKEKVLEDVLGGLIEEEEKVKKGEVIKETKPKISEEKYREYRKRIEDWKADGYDVTEIEKILNERPEQFEELSKKIIIEQFRKRRAALKKTVKK